MLAELLERRLDKDLTDQKRGRGEAKPLPPHITRWKARQCTSKHRYRDIERAKLVRKHFPNQRIYYCIFCQGYHLTKKEKER
jgi:hypothetical protein